MNTKRKIYIFLSITLGILFAFIIHSVLELAIIDLFINNPDTYGPQFTWRKWRTIHDIGMMALLILGAVGGYFLGRYWWRLVYIEKRHWKMKKKKNR